VHGLVPGEGDVKIAHSEQRSRRGGGFRSHSAEDSGCGRGAGCRWSVQQGRDIQSA
jgi:hypothetical protein